MASFEPFDVVVVPFPFTDRQADKRRPALVLSARAFNDGIRHSVMAMITSQRHTPWPLDRSLRDLDAAGLPAPSVVRMKLFTLDHRLVLRHIGRLSADDQTSVAEGLRQLLSAP